jgi:hypothetical protein
MRAVGPRTATKMTREVIGRNRLFAAVLVVSALLRLDAELGYRWQSWFNDSWDYVDTAVTLRLDPTRASGYSFYLWLLKPFHSFALVTVSQHLMGLAIGVMIYALARRRFACPKWLAVLMTLPVLLDGFEIQLEHLIMSDTLFLFLAMLALLVLLWSPLSGGSSHRAGTAPDKMEISAIGRIAISGALLGLSAIVRSTGLPLIPVFGLWLLLVLALGRVGWRRLIASVAAFGVTALAPTVAYAGWYDLQHGTFNTSESTGVFLYSRVMSFADCSKMGKLPADVLSLCSTVPVSQRPLAQAYIWTQQSPLDRFPAPKFSALPNSLAQQFAIRAIESQPLAYAKVIFEDTWRSFYFPRTAFPNDATYDEYLFGYRSLQVSSGHPADGYKSSPQAYLGGANPATAVVNPFAGAIRYYQRYVWLPGTVFGLILLAGLGTLIVGWRRRGTAGAASAVGTVGPGADGPGGAGLAALLPWVTSVALIVTPAATAEFDYRYVTTAVSFACLALAMTYASSRRRLGLGRSRAGDSVSPVSEAGGSASVPGSVPGGRLGDGPGQAGHDQRDLAPDSSPS